MTWFQYNRVMLGRPSPDEAAAYYFSYINRVDGDDPLRAMESQLEEAVAVFEGISPEKSLQRYAPDKWSLRQMLGHINDGERLFVSRALWFARGFDTPLPSFDQNIAVAAAASDRIPWSDHIEEFRRVRLAFFRGLPAEAWGRTGIASDNRFTVRALAFIVGGHVTHHIGVIRERYL